MRAKGVRKLDVEKGTIRGPPGLCPPCPAPVPACSECPLSNQFVHTLKRYNPGRSLPLRTV